MTKPPNVTIAEIMDALAATAALATKALREVSDVVAELRNAEMMLMDVSSSQASAAANRKAAPSEDPRLAWRVDELAKAIGVSRRTIERKIKDGTLKSTKALGARLVLAESVTALFEPRGGACTTRSLAQGFARGN